MISVKVASHNTMPTEAGCLDSLIGHNDLDTMNRISLLGFRLSDSIPGICATAEHYETGRYSLYSLISRLLPSQFAVEIDTALAL